MVTIGIFGGTFDPIHNGHLAVARAAQKHLRLDRVVFVPVGTPPHKRWQPVTPAEHRWQMVALAVAENPRFSVSRVDIDRPAPQYSVDTIRLLRQALGTSAENTFFIIGADSLSNLPRWKDAAGIVMQCRIAVVHRPGFHLDLKAIASEIPQLPSRLVWIEMPPVPVSATEVRRRVGQGLSIDKLVPPAVAEYIARHQLYRR